MLLHPSILDAAVIGIEQDGTEVPRAFVVPGKKISEKEIKTFVKSKVASYKQLTHRSVRILEAPLRLRMLRPRCNNQQPSLAALFAKSVYTSETHGLVGQFHSDTTFVFSCSDNFSMARLRGHSLTEHPEE